jgi:hypothetical protein
MYTCTVLFVHDRYRDSATLMIARKSNDTFVRPLKARIGADTLSPVTSLKDPSQTSLFKEKGWETTHGLSRRSAFASEESMENVRHLTHRRVKGQAAASRPTTLFEAHEQAHR